MAGVPSTFPSLCPHGTSSGAASRGVGMCMNMDTFIHLSRAGRGSGFCEWCLPVFLCVCVLRRFLHPPCRLPHCLLNCEGRKQALEAPSLCDYNVLQRLQAAEGRLLLESLCTHAFLTSYLRVHSCDLVGAWIVFLVYQDTHTHCTVMG